GLQSEKFTRLFIIVVVIFTEVMFIDGTHGFLRRHFSFRSAVVFVVAVRVVVHMGTKVSVNSHCAVTAEWAYICSTFRRVYRNLMMVHTKAVALCITIGEQTSLEHFIGCKSKPWHDVGCSEWSVFNFSNGVLRIA